MVKEVAAGISQEAKQVIQINNRTRIRDAITPTRVTEVKNVQSQSLTRQLRDNMDFAQLNNKQPFIYLREGAHVTRPLADAIRSGTMAGASLLRAAVDGAVKTLIKKK